MNWKTAVVLLSVAVWMGGCGENQPPISDSFGAHMVNALAPQATSPEILLDNLSRAMNERDKDLYETSIDTEFWFTETNCLGKIAYANGREEELAFVGGSRDGSKLGIFVRFRTVEYEFTLIKRSVELGRDYPEAFPGDPDSHPDEDWVVFRGRTRIIVATENNDAFRFDQVMTFKVHQGSDGIWWIVRWIDDPLSGGTECETSTQGSWSWGEFKAH